MSVALETDADVIAEIGALGLRELDAVKVWIASGCEGPQPRPDVVERQRLADRLMAVIDDPRPTAETAKQT